MEKKRRFELIVGGLGGQGALLIGRLLVEAGMSHYPHVLFFPNYGFLIRGGVSECTVLLSDDRITSPAILRPAAAIVMGPAALEAYESRIKPGGLMLVDSSAVSAKVSRQDLRVIYIPANQRAAELGGIQVANLIFLGAYLEMTKALPLEAIEDALTRRLARTRRESLLPLNKAALREGAKLAGELGG